MVRLIKVLVLLAVVKIVAEYIISHSEDSPDLDISDRLDVLPPIQKKIDFYCQFSTKTQM